MTNLTNPSPVMSPTCFHLVKPLLGPNTNRANPISQCSRSRSVPTTRDLDATKLHPGSRRYRQTLDLERKTRPNPHSNPDRLIRPVRMEHRLYAMLQVSCFHQLHACSLRSNKNSNIRPGGWIEQLEARPFIECDDDSLPVDSILRTWGPTLMACGERAGRPLDTMEMLQDRFREAGFVDIHTKEYKWPIGPWPRNQRFKEAGVVNYQHWMFGMEGWAMWLLTKFGGPAPWSQDEVIVYIAKLRAELKDPQYHIYERA